MTGSYRREVDGLRAVAVVPVLLYHSHVPGFASGFLGVDIFFVISGYLIAGLLLDEREQTQRISLAKFYARRIRRILPALVVVVTVTSLFAFALLTPVRMQDFSKSLMATFTFTANFWFLSQDTYFATAADEQPLLHLWSLAVEEQFYLLFPVILIATARISAERLIACLACLALLSIALSHSVAAVSDSASFFRPDTRIWELLAGAICAYWRKHRFHAALAPVGLFMVALSMFVVPGPTFPGVTTLPLVVGTGLFLLSARPDTGIGRILSLPPVVFIGIVSYSLYLWHQPMLALARIHTDGSLSPPVTAGLLSASVAAAWLTWRFVEQPARQSTRTRFVVAGSGIASVLIIALGYAGMISSGFAFRYGDKAAEYFAAVGQLDTPDARSAAIGMGVCHFRADKSPPFERFLADWSCTGSHEGASVVVVGDSHAGDKAAGFRLNGFDVAQLTGAGCSVVPERMTPMCLAMFDFILKRQREGCPFSTVVLATKVQPNKLAEKEVESTIAYWSRMDADIVWFSDMPQFIDIEDRKSANLLSYGDVRSGPFPVTSVEAQENYRLLQERARGRYAAINSDALYCSFASAQGVCLPFVDRGWTSLVGGHLTALGSYLFIRRALGAGLSAAIAERAENPPRCAVRAGGE